ncbi:MAG TPA: DUF4383 domain-containing protein [Acidimicrobiales bacterium]
MSRPARPQVPLLLLAVTGVEVLVLLAAGVGLLLVPASLRAVWPWDLTALNAAFLGAVYTSSLVAAAGLVLVGRASPARVVAPMILLFTVVVLAVSVASLDRFAASAPSSWLWLLLYVGIPANAAWHLRRRGGWWSWPDPGPPSAASRRWLRAGALAAAAYGSALLVAPTGAAAFWPWPVDAFHGRMYSVALLTPALGMWLVAERAARTDLVVLGATLLAGGTLPVAAVAGVAATGAGTGTLAWTAGTWLWAAMFASLGAVGAGLLAEARRRPPETPAAERWNAAALVVPVRETALLLGVAFTVAGVAGLLPPLVPALAADHPTVEVSAASGRLLGLFPVNVVHTGFHLAAGVAGLVAHRRHAWSRRYVRWFAVVLWVLAVMGAVPALHTVFGLAPLFDHDVWLHGVEAAAATYIGIVQPDRPPAGVVSGPAPAPAVTT